LSGEPTVRDFLLLETGDKLLLDIPTQVGHLMLETSVLADLTDTNSLTKPIDFKRPDEK